MIRQRRGVTLIELVVTIALLAILTAVATLAVRTIQRPPPNDPASMLADSLTAAIGSSHPITVVVLRHGDRAFATANPDGTVTADSVFRTDALTGRPTNVR
jgi:prepilin-type N-terminal cleavage/methylation domain-containing protein